MELAPSVRILEFSRDPLFGAVYPDSTDWVSTGRPLEPAGRQTNHANTPRIPWPLAIARAILARYDLIVFPAIRLRTPGDRKNRGKRRLRQAIMAVSRSRLTAWTVRHLLHLGRVDHIIRDVGDFPEIEEVTSRLFPNAHLYLKREVLVSDLGHRLNGGPLVMYTPMPFDFSAYEGPSVAKTTDVFFAARDAGEYRRQARSVLVALRAEGIVVDIPDERVSFEEYLERIRRARLVVSPRGQGEHCYRHYEALLLGAVPVINHPDKPIYYELEDGVTALFYEPDSDDLASVIRDALASPERLEAIAKAGATLVRTRHGKDAICSDVVGSMPERPKR